MSRLQHHGYIEGYLVVSRDGPKRKYYRLLPAGAKQLERWQTEWETFAQAVEHILKGAQSGEQSRRLLLKPGREKCAPRSFEEVLWSFVGWFTR